MLLRDTTEKDVLDRMGQHERSPFKSLAPVAQTLDSTIHWTKHYPLDNLVLLVFILWIAIYPVDSAIHRLNNWGLVFMFLLR